MESAAGAVLRALNAAHGPPRSLALLSPALCPPGPSPGVRAECSRAGNAGRPAGSIPIGHTCP